MKEMTNKGDSVLYTMKRSFCLFIASLLLLFTLTSCGEKEKTSQGNAQLSMVEGDLSNFSAKTMSGKTFTQDNFKDYDMTIINVWSTTCMYCLEEMEGLEILYEKLPDNVNFITICTDAGFDMDLAQTILTKKGATFETLIGNKDLNNGLLQNLIGTPTTVFVDSAGKLVGKAMVGAPCTEDIDRAADNYLEAANDHLKELGL